MSTETPLPYGWVQQVDPKSGHIFYASRTTSKFVDTKADPPRSIWTHPYEDEVYLSEHPDRRAKVRGSNSFGSDASLPLPPYEPPRRHSFNGRPATPVGVPPPKHKQGFFDKLKAKAVNSMEQHNERKRQQLLMQQKRMEQLYSQPQYSTTRYAAPQCAYPRDYYGGMGYGRSRGGMGGMALPLMGGMVGGLLLGDMIGGDMGGGFGGGGFDGGFGGGGFF